MHARARIRSRLWQERERESEAAGACGEKRCGALGNSFLGERRRAFGAR